MTTGRMEAFSDGVLAVIITVMVLELHAPDGRDWAALQHVGLGFLTYLLSFVYVGIYWNNHHHLCRIVEHVDGRVLWANLHLLFWLSLFPFTTAWLDDTKVALAPTVLYGVNLMLAAIAFFMLQRAVMRDPDTRATVEAVFGRDLKGKASPVLYLLGIGLAFITPWIGLVPMVAVALMWVVPDRRVERYLTAERA